MQYRGEHFLNGWETVSFIPLYLAALGRWIVEQRRNQSMIILRWLISNAFVLKSNATSSKMSQLIYILCNKLGRNTAKEIASAMLHLHNSNILHGDLSGGNVLLVSSEKDLERGWYAKVGDFGLSRVLTAEAISTGTYGTVTHMPPELLTTGPLLLNV